MLNCLIFERQMNPHRVCVSNLRRTGLFLIINNILVTESCLIFTGQLIFSSERHLYIQLLY